MVLQDKLAGLEFLTTELNWVILLICIWIKQVTFQNQKTKAYHTYIIFLQ